MNGGFRRQDFREEEVPDADTSAFESQFGKLVYKLDGLIVGEVAIVEGCGKTGAEESETAAKPSRRRTPRQSTAADSSREEDDEELE